MDIIVFSETEKIRGIFPRHDKRNSCRISFNSRSEIKQTVSSADNGSLLYFDIEGYSEKERKSLLRSLSRSPHIRYGIIDPLGEIEDVAELFFDGAADYIGPGLTERNITNGRLKKAGLFNISKPGDKGNDNGNSIKNNRNLLISGDTWEGITQGKEYTFCFMFISLDNQSMIEKKLGAGHLEKIREAFMSIIVDMVAPMNGRLWMYSGAEAIVLFPFNGNSCPAIVAALELVFARKVFNFEEFDFNTAISFRTILHLGNTVYKKRGETGNIVSDSVNFLFHCAHQYSPPGSLLITETLFDMFPGEIDDLFVNSESFEKVRIKRLKTLL